jgi:hypothetical protein
VRIRSIKPEFWKSERMAQLPRDVRMLFIGLWNLADDFGRFRAHPSLVKGELFAYDDDADVGAWLSELSKAGVVVLYTVNGQRYGFVRNFAEHQKIDRRAASRIPPPPGEKQEEPTTTCGAHADQEPTPADEPAEPADNPAGPADFTPVDQGAGSRERNREHGPRARVRTREGPAAPRRVPEAEPGSGASSRSRDDGTSPIADLTSALLATRYRGGIGNAIVRRASVREQAERLVHTGLQPQQVRELSDLAAQKSSDDPGALLSHWLDGDWRGVLDEQDAKGRQKAARSRGAAQAPADGGDADRLAYAESGTPRAAGSVLGEVLSSVRTA